MIVIVATTIIVHFYLLIWCQMYAIKMLTPHSHNHQYLPFFIADLLKYASYATQCTMSINFHHWE